MNILDVHANIIADYADYTQSFIDIADTAIRDAVTQQLTDKRFWPDPLLQFNPAYRRAGRIDTLAAEGKFHAQMGAIFAQYELYQHQLDAITLGLQNTDFIVTSGTGSGKSLTYMATIFDHVLRNPATRGVVAVIVYPMNALINSQTEELNRYRAQYERQTGKPFPIRYGQYTGQESEEERQRLRENPPHIILTNYMMLELMMTRAVDKPIITSIQEQLRYLVFDEMHTYRGRQGAGRDEDVEVGDAGLDGAFDVLQPRQHLEAFRLGQGAPEPDLHVAGVGVGHRYFLASTAAMMSRSS